MSNIDIKIIKIEYLENSVGNSHRKVAHVDSFLLITIYFYWKI